MMHLCAGIEYPWQGIFDGDDSVWHIASACLDVLNIGHTESHEIENAQGLFLCLFVLHK